MDHVILVDSKDHAVGTMDKMEAHQKGLLHRAFSIILFDKNGRILLQKRAANKYHSGGLWTNTCCSHQKPHETMEEATRRRLVEEMGIDMSTQFLFRFHYRAELDSNLIENEMDHVYTGIFNGKPQINPEEVDDWKYLSLPDLKEEIRISPEKYSSWFKIIMNSLPKYLDERIQK